MKISLKDVEYIALLAHLRFTSEEKETIARQLNDILAYMEKLNQLDTKAVEPASHVIPLKNIFRGDNLSPSLPSDESLKNAPDQEDRFFKVPKIIGG